MTDPRIVELVHRARGGDGTALETLCNVVTDETGFRIWADRKAAGLDLIDQDGMLQFLRQAAVSAIHDDGSMRWDEGRGTPFKTWTFMVCHDRYLHVALRSQGSQRRTAPGGWVDIDELEAVGAAPGRPSHERALDARMTLERIFEELRGHGMMMQADVLELMWQGYKLGEIAGMLCGEDDKGLGKVRYALKSARSFCRHRRDTFLG